jgi:hypothetical protein
MTALFAWLAIMFAVLTQNGDPTVHEDNPYWNCEIHGNQICGKE